jgi:carbamoyl-phosphate synthase large subunit
MAEQHRLASCGIKVALPDAKTYSVTNDKWLTHQFLTQKGIPATPTLLLSEPVDALLAQMDFPLIIKQRRGSGGKGLRLVNDLESLHLLRRQLHGREYLVQPLVGREDEEFTCGSYRTLTGRLLGPILLRRKLGYGSTIKATSEYRPELALWVNQLLSHLSGQGPFCCQVRMVDEEPRLLEVNYRLSSSTSIKASLGFNEPAMLVQELILGQEPSEPKITWGQTIARYLEDMVL